MNKYYHIQYSGFEKAFWKKGDIISTSTVDLNSYTKGLLRDMVDKKNVNGKEVGLIDYSNSIFEKDSNRNIQSDSTDYKSLYIEYRSNSLEYESLANELHWSFLQYLKWVREEVFESIRLEVNTLLPSRKRCVWVCTKDDLSKWWKMFGEKPNKKILELDLKGDRIFRGDGTLIKADTFSLSEYVDLAKRYWSGIIESSQEIEISYEGEFEVVNEFNDLSEILKKSNTLNK